MAHNRLQFPARYQSQLPHIRLRIAHLQGLGKPVFELEKAYMEAQASYSRICTSSKVITDAVLCDLEENLYLKEMFCWELIHPPGPNQGQLFQGVFPCKWPGKNTDPALVGAITHLASQDKRADFDDYAAYATARKANDAERSNSNSLRDSDETAKAFQNPNVRKFRFESVKNHHFKKAGNRAGPLSGSNNTQKLHTETNPSFHSPTTNNQSSENRRLAARISTTNSNVLSSKSPTAYVSPHLRGQLPARPRLNPNIKPGSPPAGDRRLVPNTQAIQRVIVHDLGLSSRSRMYHEISDVHVEQCD